MRWKNFREMGILTFVRRHAVRLNPARYVLAEETQGGELKPVKFEITYRERTLPVTFPVKFKDGSDGWYTGRVHEIVENDKVGIFALSKEEETSGFVYDPNNEEHLGTPCSTVPNKIMQLYNFKNINITPESGN